MLRQVAGKAQQRLSQSRGATDFGRLGVEAGLADMLVRNAVAVAAPNGVRQGRRDVFGQAEGLADLADGHARAIVDDGGDDGRPLAAIAAVDVLHHLLAPLMLEIDIDVRRLAALLGDEP